jgi:hypothetical protein
MAICKLCEAQAKRKNGGKPHDDLTEMGSPRVFSGVPPRGFTEQDYQCLVCQARFTQSTNRNDLAWTLWEAS